MARIDRQVDRLMAEASGLLGPDAYPPAAPAPLAPAVEASTRIDRHSAAANERPPTANPPAASLQFRAMQDADDVLSRLESYNLLTGDPLRMDLATALAIAFRQSRDYLFAEEDYVLAALRLLIERHRWGPLFFDEVSAEVVAAGDEGFYDTSLQVVNELRVTQRLPYGGEVSARALARAVHDLHSRAGGGTGDSESADIILDANIPLLRGSGLAARESRIQAERDLIYAARDFEQFRRDFLFDIVQDFLNLVVQQQSVINAERQVEQLRLVEDRERALYESGRTDLFNAALAEQSVVSALDSLNQRRESYRLGVDRFKVRLNIPVDQVVVIVPSSLGLPVPQTDMEMAVRAAMSYRLDLQTQRDVVDDARRNVAIARNDLLPDLDATASLQIGSDPSRPGFRLEPDESVVRAGLSLGLPIDRQTEQLGLRQSQIQLERSLRNFGELRDNIAVSVRGAVRDIDRARYTLMIQERNIAIGEERIESIEAAPDRATARDASEAADELLEAMDRRDEAMRDLELAILAYLLETGQLRVTHEGMLQLLPGMVLRSPESSAALRRRIDFLVIPGFIVLPMPPATLQPVPGHGAPQPPPPPPPEADNQDDSGAGEDEGAGGGPRAPGPNDQSLLWMNEALAIDLPADRRKSMHEALWLKRCLHDRALAAPGREHVAPAGWAGAGLGRSSRMHRPAIATLRDRQPSRAHA